REFSMTLGASMPEVCAGSVVTISPNREFPAGTTLEWSVNGQPTSKGQTFEFGTTGRSPGTYNIGLTASAPEYNDGMATTMVTVQPYRAPNVVLQVSPGEIWVGEKASLTPG